MAKLQFTPQFFERVVNGQHPTKDVVVCNGLRVCAHTGQIAFLIDDVPMVVLPLHHDINKDIVTVVGDFTVHIPWSIDNG